MAKINRLAECMLSLLDSKNLGDNPDDLSRTVAPVLELSDFYFHGRVLEGALVTAAATIAGPYAVLTIPSLETWAVRAVTSTLDVTGAGGTFPMFYLEMIGTASSQIAQALTPPSGYGPVKLGAGEATGERYVTSRVFERPFLCRGGTTFQTFLSRPTSGATLRTAVAFYRLQQ